MILAGAVRRHRETPDGSFRIDTCRSNRGIFECQCSGAVVGKDQGGWLRPAEEGTCVGEQPGLRLQAPHQQTLDRKSQQQQCRRDTPHVSEVGLIRPDTGECQHCREHYQCITAPGEMQDRLFSVARALQRADS